MTVLYAQSSNNALPLARLRVMQEILKRVQDDSRGIARTAGDAETSSA